MEVKYKVFAIALSLVLVGCSDPKEPNEKNFKVAVQQYLDTEYPKCFFIEDFPVESSSHGIMENYENLTALSKAGILNAEELSRQEVPPSTFSKGYTNIKTRFSLTDLGKKYYRALPPGQAASLKKNGLCFGKAEVVSINNFTQPNNMMGKTISIVNYSYTAKDIPDWAKNKDILKQFNYIDDFVNSADNPVKGKTMLVLTNKGWIADRLIRNP